VNMAQRYDAVIIGGGHNGLVTAAFRHVAFRHCPPARILASPLDALAV